MAYRCARVPFRLHLTSTRTYHRGQTCKYHFQSHPRYLWITFPSPLYYFQLFSSHRTIWNIPHVVVVTVDNYPTDGDHVSSIRRRLSSTIIIDDAATTDAVGHEHVDERCNGGQFNIAIDYIVTRRRSIVSTNINC